MSETCPRSDRCPLFPELRHTLETWKMSYCHDHRGRWKQCERFLLTERGEQVPPLLLPNGKLLAQPPAK